MTDKDRELQELRRENKALKFEIEKLKHEISKWEHCHRQDMEDNLRLKNQLAQLLGVNNGGKAYGRNEDRTG